MLTMLRATTRALPVLVALTVAAGSATAQDAAPVAAPAVTMRIGVILPAVDGNTSPFDAAVARAAEQGTALGADEVVENAAMLDIGVQILYERANGAADVAAAAQRLVDQGAYGVVGGYNFDETRALSQWAEGAGVPFINIGATEDSLRNEFCAANTFHLEASAGMYLDAIAGWYVRAGFRRWYIISSAGDQGDALYTRLRWTMENKLFGAREAGHAVVPAGAPVTGNLVRDVTRSNADLVIVLTNAEDQLQVLTALDSGGFQGEVAGYPYPNTQTRTFYAAYRAAAPRLGAGYRASNWEWTIDNYGAREYNARYADRFGEPMDEMAWATFHAVKILFEAAFFGQSTVPADVINYMESPASVFDLHKGIAVSFRPWDRQIRESLFLIKIADDTSDPFTMALLVGELPAIYMPGTDPIERLDQLGDVAAQSRCRVPSGG